MRWARHVAFIGQKRNASNILVENPKERDHLEDLDVDGRILKYTFIGIGCESLDWIHLAQDGDQCRALV
jgi:hypothetical protein